MLLTLAPCIVFVNYVYLSSVAASSGWNYDDNHSAGPSHWHLNFGICNDSNQSPVNIVSATEDEDLDNFSFSNYDVTTGVSCSLQNDGHSAKLKESGVKIMMSGGGLPGDYVFEQLHFHWGHNDSIGSEHTINGVHYPMEMHLVHYASSHGNFSTAVDKTEGLAVLGFFFQISDEDNANLDELITALASVTNTDDTTVVTTFPISSLFSDALGPFYRYSGSLTTPPCYESVIWTVFTNTIRISSSQMAEFRTLLDEDLHALEDNFRPVQSLNSRSVYYYAGENDNNASK